MLWQLYTHRIPRAMTLVRVTRFVLLAKMPSIESSGYQPEASITWVSGIHIRKFNHGHHLMIDRPCEHCIGDPYYR